MAQTEGFIFHNVAYRPTGAKAMCNKTSLTLHRAALNRWNAVALRHSIHFCQNIILS